jgi:hypothetical protein
MEIIILGIVLFIIGIGATMVYDNMKANGKSLTDYLPKVNQGDEELKAFAKAQKANTVRTQKPANSQSLDDLLNEVKARHRAGQSTVRVQQGTTTQTMSVQDLIKQLERMKKNL